MADTPNLTHRLISLMQFALVLVLLVIGIHLIIRNYGGVKYSREFEGFYNKLEGEDPRYAREAMAAAEAEPEERRDAEYYYRLGVITQHNLNDAAGAEKYYTKALQMLNQEMKAPDQVVANNDYIFLTDRIADNARAARNTWLQNNANRLQAHGMRNQLENLINLNDPNLVREQMALFADRTGIQPTNTSELANAIEKAKTFKSDSQNVHDSALNNDLAFQFRKLRRYNDAEDIQASIENFKSRSTDKNKNKRVTQALNVIKSNAAETSLIGGTEYQLLDSVYKRMHSRDNQENREKMLEALEDQLDECVTGETSTVCVAGRCGHVLSSLALLDKDPDLGILKTKEVLRNELLNDAAKIVERYTGEKSTIPKTTLDDFNAGRDSPEVGDLKSTMTKEITDLGNKYNGRLPDDQKNLLVQQSIAVIQ
jgi:hypothetical protein